MDINHQASLQRHRVACWCLPGSVQPGIALSEAQTARMVASRLQGQRAACSAMCRVQVPAGQGLLGADLWWPRQSLQAQQLFRAGSWEGAVPLSTAANARKAARRLQSTGCHGGRCAPGHGQMFCLQPPGDTGKACRDSHLLSRCWQGSGCQAQDAQQCRHTGAQKCSARGARCSAPDACSWRRQSAFRHTGCLAPQQPVALRWMGPHHASQLHSLLRTAGRGARLHSRQGRWPSPGRSLCLAAPLICRQRLPGSWRPQCAGAGPQSSAAGAGGGAPGPPPPSPAGSSNSCRSCSGSLAMALWGGRHVVE